MDPIQTYVDKLFSYDKRFNFDDIRQVEVALREMGIGQGKDFWQTLQAVNAAVKYGATRTGRNGFSLSTGTGMGRYLPMDGVLLTMTARAQTGYDRVASVVGMNVVISHHYRKFTEMAIRQYFRNCSGDGHINQPISQRCRHIKGYIDSSQMNCWTIARMVCRSLCEQLSIKDMELMPTGAAIDSIFLASPKFLYLLTLIEDEATKQNWNTDTAFYCMRIVMDREDHLIEPLLQEIIERERARRNKK